MEQTVLQATKRQELGSHAAARLRRQGLVPAVLYGHKLESVPLAVSLRDVQRLVQTRARMVSLEIGGTVETALVREIQYDSMGDAVLHVDFSRVAMDQKVTVVVPVELHGLAKGVASGGVLEHLVQDVQVRCLPGDIPERIRVEISNLDVGGVIYLRDLPRPAGVEFLQDPETRVVSIHAKAAAAEAPAPAEAEAAAEPELIRRERGEEGEEEEKEEKE